jgi:hypothetical protein
MFLGTLSRSISVTTYTDTPQRCESLGEQAVSMVVTSYDSCCQMGRNEMC